MKKYRLLILAAGIIFFNLNVLAQATQQQREDIQRFFEESQRKRDEEAKEKREMQERNRLIDIRNDSIKRVEQEARIQRAIEDSIQESKDRAEEIVAEKKWAQQQKQDQIEATKKKAEREKSILSQYGDRDGRMILNRQVAIGWTKQMCIASWGKPIKINTTINSLGTQEQWVYSLSKYLYFYGNKLYTIQK